MAETSIFINYFKSMLKSKFGLILRIQASMIQQINSGTHIIYFIYSNYLSCVFEVLIELFSIYT